MVEEDTIVGDVFVRTTYERFTLPVYMRVAHGKISLKKLIFTDCFPVSCNPSFQRQYFLTFTGWEVTIMALKQCHILKQRIQ